jgi:thiol-disulfide isomerase/thioredoxin
MSQAFFIYGSLALTWCLLLGLAISVLRIQRGLATVLRTLEGRAAEGLPLGSVAPSFEGEAMMVDRSGKRTESRMPMGAYSQPTVVWFMSAGCPPCLAQRRVISQLAAEYQGKANMIVNCVGDSAATAYFAEELLGPVTVFADPKRVTVREWRVFLSPFAVVVDASGVIKRKIATITTEQVQLALDSVMDSSGPIAAENRVLATLNA